MATTQRRTQQATDQQTPPQGTRVRVAVVTGGSQGLGLALARELARAGWALVVDARRADRLAAATAGLPSGTRVVAVPGDVTDPAHRADLAAAARSLGGVDLLVHNASTLGASPLPRVDDLGGDVLARTLAVNVVAPVELYRALLGDLRPGATVVAVTSDAGVEAYPGWGGYGASKAALEHVHRVLALERPDLRVLVVDPGDMRTEMHQDAFPGEDVGDRPDPAVAASAIAALVASDAPSGRHTPTADPRSDPHPADRPDRSGHREVA